MFRFVVNFKGLTFKFTLTKPIIVILYREIFVVVLLSVIINLPSLNCFSQGSVDGFMKGKGNLDVAGSYSMEKASHYFAGNKKIEFSNEMSSLGIFAAYGITNWSDVIVNIPIVNGKLQDGSVYAKFGKSNIPLGNTQLTIAGAMGFSFPLNKYPTELANSIGQQAYLLQPRLTAQYYPIENFFINVRGGFNHSIEVVPSSYIYSFKIGYFKNKLYTDLWIDFQEAIGGKDYRGIGDLKPNSFRELGVSYFKTGGVIFYQATNRFGGFISGAKTWEGRNTFTFLRLTVGVVMKFTTSKKEN